MFELKLEKAGKPGPKLVPHEDGPPCDQPGRSPGDGLPGFPSSCHSLEARGKAGNLFVVGSRDVSIDDIAGAFSGIVPLELGRPLIDKTGLKGRFDFTLEFAPESRMPSDAPIPAAPVGPTPLEALRDQLGLKLEPAKDPLPFW